LGKPTLGTHDGYLGAQTTVERGAAATQEKRGGRESCTNNKGTTGLWIAQRRRSPITNRNMPR